MSNKIKADINLDSKIINKNSVSFLLKIKRGISWSTRRVEIDKERFRYFKPDDGELRFSEKIEDCVLIEKHLNEPKKYYILLASKTNSFNKVKIASDNIQNLKKLKDEFERIIHYKTTMATLQHKTFIIETEADDDKNAHVEKIESVNQSVLGDPSVFNRDLISVYNPNEDMISTLDFNKRKSQISMNEDFSLKNMRQTNTPMSKLENIEELKFERSTILKTIIDEEIQPISMNKILLDNNVDKKPVINQNEYLNPNSSQTNQKIEDDKMIKDVGKIEDHKSDNLKNEKSDSLRWETLKYSKHSLVELGSNDNNDCIRKNFISAIISCEDEYIAKQDLLKDQIQHLNSSYNNIKQNQVKTIILIVIVFTVSLSLIFQENTLLIMVISTIISVLLKLYTLQQKEELVKNNLKEENIIDNFTKEIKNSKNETYIKVSSIFNENSKNMSNHLTNIKSYVEWNRFIFAVNNYNKEDNSASYFYLNSFQHNSQKSATEIKIKRKSILNKNITIIEKAEVNGVKNLKTKVYSIEASKNNQNKCKVSLVVPLKILIEHSIPLTYLKSAIDSLDLLQLYVENKNFNQEPTEELEFSGNRLSNANNFTNERNYNKKLSHAEAFTTSSLIKKKDSLLVEASILNTMPNIGITQKHTNEFRMSIPFSDLETEFKEVDNKFSICEKKSEERENNYNNITNITAQSQVRHKDSLIVKYPTIVDFALQKENDEIQLIIDLKLKNVDEFFVKEWKLMEDKPEYKSYYFDEKSGFRSVKSECVIDKNIRPLFDYLADIKKRNKYDKNFDSGHTIRQVNEKITLNYLKYKGKLTISPRDFTIATHVNFAEDECLILATSYNSEKYPKVKGIERADLILGGFKLKRLDEFKTLFTFFSLSDLKLAQFLVNTSLKEVAMCAKHFKELFK